MQIPKIQFTTEQTTSPQPEVHLSETHKKLMNLLEEISTATNFPLLNQIIKQSIKPLSKVSEDELVKQISMIRDKLSEVIS
jgi:hypothetical protein